jgi:hypothetical protein
MHIQNAKQMSTTSLSYRHMMRNIIPFHDFIAAGNNWYPVETYEGTTFRWVHNDAELIISAPSGKYSKISMELEAGPSLGRTSFILEIQDIYGRVVAEAGVMNRAIISFDVPLVYNETAIFRLHVESDDMSVTGDNRIMNYRVFALGWAHLLDS